MECGWCDRFLPDLPIYACIFASAMAMEGLVSNPPVHCCIHPRSRSIRPLMLPAATQHLNLFRPRAKAVGGGVTNPDLRKHPIRSAATVPAGAIHPTLENNHRPIHQHPNTPNNSSSNHHHLYHHSSNNNNNNIINNNSSSSGVANASVRKTPAN